MVTDLSLGYGLVIMFFSSVLCSSAGVGGGSLNVPILYSIIGFDYDTAVILSLCTLMGNYLLQVLVNLDKRHPSEVTMPLIYWDAVLIMLPAELGGANFGVILAKSMPKTIVFILAIVVLVIAIYFSAKKGLRLYDKETLLIQADLDNKHEEFFSAYSNARSPLLTDAHDRNSREQDVSIDKSEAALSRRIAMKKPPAITLSSIFPPYLCCYYSLCDRLGICSDKTRRSGKGGSLHAALTTTEEEEGEEQGGRGEPALPPIEFPWAVIVVIGAVFVLYVACYVVQKQYNQCSTGSYISLTIIYLLLVFQVTWGIRHLIKQYESKLNDTSPGNKGIVEGEIHWGPQSAVVPFVSFLIGVTSALLGIGGGELMGPMLLQFKVLAPVSTASTSFMSMLNTSASVMHYIVLGELPFGYGAAVFGVGALGGVTGRVLALYFVAHYRRASLLILSLVGVLCCSIFIYGYYLIDYKKEFAFSSMCS